MIEKIIQYLKQKQQPASSTELARQVLRTENVDALVAEKIIQSVAGENHGVRKNSQGEWYVDDNDASQHIPPDFREEAVLVKAFPARVNSWSQWQALGIAVYDVEKGFTVEWLFGSVADRNLSHNREESFRRLAAMTRDRVVVCDGIGNQVSILRRALSVAVGYDIETEIISLKRMCQKEFQTAIHSEADISRALGLRALESAAPELAIRCLVEQFEELYEYFKKTYGEGAFLSREDEDLSSVDFSLYAFDRAFIKTLPMQPGVYLMKDRNDEVIYIGKAGKLKRRVQSYFTGPADEDEKLTLIRQRVYNIELVPAGSELEALLLEHQLISQYDPPINKQFHIFRRTERTRFRYHQIVLLPASREMGFKIYLLSPEKGLIDFDLASDLSNIHELEERIQNYYFGGSDVAPGSFDLYEIATSWLRANADAVNSIDMRKVTTASEAVRLIKDYTRSMANRRERVVQY